MNGPKGSLAGMKAGTKKLVSFSSDGDFWSASDSDSASSVSVGTPFSSEYSFPVSFPSGATVEVEGGGVVVMDRGAEVFNVVLESTTSMSAVVVLVVDVLPEYDGPTITPSISEDEVDGALVEVTAVINVVGEVSVSVNVVEDRTLTVTDAVLEGTVVIGTLGRASVVDMVATGLETCEFGVNVGDSICVRGTTFDTVTGEPM